MRVAVVTGGNKGIGFAIVKALAEQFDGVVYLTARNEQLGQESLKALSSGSKSRKCTEVKFHQLDLTDKASIDRFRDYLKSSYGGLDVLVNNAAIAYTYDSTTPFSEQAEVTLKTNYFGTLAVCQALFPLLRSHARVVNVSSQVGMLKIVPSEALRKQLISESVTIDQISQIGNDFIRYTKEGNHQEKGFPNTAYGTSKVLLTALTFVQQRQFDADSREDIIVNACCPGYVNTDMSSHAGHLTPEQGAETPTYLAMLPPNSKEPKGKFVYQKRVLQWAA